MKISDKLAAHQTFSFEIFPPKGDLPLEKAFEIAGAMATCGPDWISVTYSAGGSGNSDNTVAIAGSIEEKLNTTALAHLTCMGSTAADVDAYVAALAADGVQNILALRGDRRPGRGVVDFAHASDLIAHLRATAGDAISIGAACYPEGHVESPTEDADYLVSQLFFSNDDFYRFREKCLRHRIKLPIVAGIMPVTNVQQIRRSCQLSGSVMPPRLQGIADRFGDDPAAMRQAGIAYATEQILDLIAHGVEHIHIYTMNKPDVAAKIMDNLSDILRPHG